MPAPNQPQSPLIAFGQSREEARLSLGQAVVRSPAGGFILANASTPGLYPAVGLVYSRSLQNFNIGVITAGHITLGNWMAATGSELLAGGQTYYLSGVSGLIVAGSAPEEALEPQAIGIALNSLTLRLTSNMSLDTATLPVNGNADIFDDVASAPPGGLVPPSPLLPCDWIGVTTGAYYKWNPTTQAWVAVISAT